MRGNICNEYNKNKIGLINRYNFILDMIKKHSLLKVLHIGCCDAINQNSSICINRKTLHNYLYDQISNIDGLRVDGLDINADAINNMRNFYTKSIFYTDIDDIKESYDLIVIPEVLEHVDNIQDFVSKVKNINTKKTIITVPSINNIQTYKSTLVISNSNYIENVHSDHNVWFSPYTLSNIVKKYWNIKVDKIYLLGNLSIGIIF